MRQIQEVKVQFSAQQVIIALLADAMKLHE